MSTKPKTLPQFPDCELHWMEQRSAEWHDARKGVLTATSFGPWLLKSDKTSAKARETAICKCLSTMANGYETGIFVNEAMQRGIDLEPLAVEDIEKSEGITITDVGFARDDFYRIGCSPDGLDIENGVGFETKSPTGSKHYAYKRAGILPVEYEWQVLGSMAITGAKAWWFQSFHPGFKTFRILVERTDKVDDIAAALQEFGQQLEEAIDAEAAEWEEETA